MAANKDRLFYTKEFCGIYDYYDWEDYQQSLLSK